MKNKIIFKIMTASLGIFVSATLPFTSFAAYVQNSAAAVGALVGSDIITADAGFAEGTDGWEVSGGSASVADGAVSIDAAGGAALTTDIGGEFYKSASSSEALAWDFEDDSEVADDITLSGDENVGKWSTVRPSRMPCYTESVDDVEGYNVRLREEVGEKPLSDSTYGTPVNWDKDLAEHVLIPPEGSERCLTVYNEGDKPWKDYMGARVKLSRDMLKVGEEYTLSFWMMESTHRRSIYCGRTPYYEGELEENTDSALNNGVLDYKDWKHNLVAEVTHKWWIKYSISFTPTEEEFNEDGYTTLWIITTGKHKPGNSGLTNKNNIYKYEKFYFDNICLERTAGEPKTTDYRFVCKVKGDKGRNVTAKVEIDGKETLLELKKTLDGNGDWESMSADFTVGSNMPYLSGSDRGSCFAESDPRVKLHLQADGSIEADYVHLVQIIDGSLERHAGKPICFIADVMGLENLSDVNAVCEMDGQRIVDSTVDIKSGINSFAFEGEMPVSIGEAMHFDMTVGGRSIFDKENSVTLFFKNGANIYPSVEALKVFGAGQYLAEFEVSGGTAGDKATISIGGITESADISDGSGLAEIHLTKDDIENLKDSDKITVTCDKAVSNITLKKVGDF